MTSFSVKEGVKPEKRGFQPMRKKLGEKFGVVFSFTVVVTDTVLSVVTLTLLPAREALFFPMLVMPCVTGVAPLLSLYRGFGISLFPTRAFAQ